MTQTPIPWEDPARTGFFDRFVETVKLLATAPAEAFERMPTAGGIGKPLFFAITVGWIGIAVASVWMVILLVVGLSTAHRISRGNAAIAVFLPVVLCCAFMMALMFMGVLAGVASSQ